MVPVTMSSMVEDVHQRTGQDEQERQSPQQVCPVFRPQKEGRNREEPDQRPLPTAVVLLIASMLVNMVHDVLYDVRARCSFNITSQIENNNEGGQA
jgi:hypothetical protein